MEKGTESLDIDAQDDELSNALDGSGIADASIDLPEITDGLNDEIEEASLSTGELDSILDDVDESQSMDLNQDLPEIADELKSEDEAVSLSNDELDSILDDVDESQVMDLSQDLPEITDELKSEDEAVSLSSDELDSILDDVDESQVMDLSQDLPEITDELKSEDETVSLSDDELDNILDDVDESQVMDLSQDADSNDIVSVSGKELDQIADDDKDFDPTLAFSGDESDNVQESLDFEKEIMADAEGFQDEVEVDKVDELEGIVDGNDPLDAPQTIENDPGIVDEPLNPDVAAQIEPISQGRSTGDKRAKKHAHFNEDDIDDVDLFDLFDYLDQLLDHLPKDKIVEFAESKYYDKYISLINRLGIKE